MNAATIYNAGDFWGSFLFTQKRTIPERKLKVKRKIGQQQSNPQQASRLRYRVHDRLARGEYTLEVRGKLYNTKGLRTGRLKNMLSVA